MSKSGLRLAYSTTSDQKDLPKKTTKMFPDFLRGSVPKLRGAKERKRKEKKLPKKTDETFSDFLRSAEKKRKLKESKSKEK